MGGAASSIRLKKKGPFLTIKDNDGQVRRVIRNDDGSKTKIPAKRIFFQIDDITTVSQKLEQNDVVLTLVNGVEYCLDDLEDPDGVYDYLVEAIYRDEDDGSDEDD